MPFLQQMLAQILLPQAKEGLRLVLELAAPDSNLNTSAQLGANWELSLPLFYTLLNGVTSRAAFQGREVRTERSSRLANSGLPGA